MPTQDELREAMNDLAAGIGPLPAADLLRGARRRRARIRLAAMTGAAVAVAGIFFVLPGQSQPPVVPPAIGMVSVTPSETASAPPTREQRFVFGPETESETGTFSSVITDTVTPPGPERQTPAEANLDRLPGEKRLPDMGDGEERQVRQIVLAGTPVRVFSEPAGAGTRHEFQWISGGALYLLRSEPAMTSQDVVYGPTEADLEWIVERLLKG